MSAESEAENGLPRTTTQLDFYQAMKDFTTMFPEMDRDVIEEVLRANQGAVDATIDQLLSMSTDNMNEALRLDLEKTEAGPDVTKHCMSPNRSTRKWNPPHLGPLPPTFLRITGSSQENSECVEDERIAMFLQNEEFLSELKINQDFMSSLDGDLGERSAHEDFREKLRHMGKVSKNKFSQLARVFQRRKKSRSSKGLLDHSSGDGLLLGGDSLQCDDLSNSPSPSQSNHRG